MKDDQQHKYDECFKLPDEIHDIIFSYLNWFNIYANESTLKLFKLRLFTHINNDITQCRWLIYSLFFCMNFQITFYDRILIFHRIVKEYLFVTRLKTTIN